jgi:hypothetical protein
MSKSIWILRRDIPYNKNSDSISCVETSNTYGRCCLCQEVIKKNGQICDKSFQDVIVTSYDESLEYILNSGYHAEACSSTTIVYCDN